MVGTFEWTRLDVWWQGLLAYYAIGAVALFLWVWAVFRFARVASEILDEERLDAALLTAWGNRWMWISFAGILAFAIFGLAWSWSHPSLGLRILSILLVSAGSQMAAMGAVFCFCALPQIGSRVGRPGSVTDPEADPLPPGNGGSGTPPPAPPA